MSGGWVAAGVRARALARRRLGPDLARRLAACRTLDDALDALSGSAYRQEIKPGMDLPAAQRAVSATLLWHLRVMAGWCPPLDPTPVRLLAGGFEIANVVGHLLRLSGGPPIPPAFVLGSLSTAWPDVSAARSAPEVRVALARSPWGDPLTDDVGGLNLYMRLRWAARVYEAVPEAAPWAREATTLLSARARELRVGDPLAGRTRRPLQEQPPAASGPYHPDAWLEERRWWQGMERAAADLAGRPPHGSEPVVGVIGLLAADAWRVRAGLALATGGGGDLGEVVGVA